MKKKFVLLLLFVFPLVVYLFFASGVNNFGRLPVLVERVPELSTLDGNIGLDGKITILGILGKGIGTNKGNAFNLNQKIYKRFGEFNDFQVVMLVLRGHEDEALELKEELGKISDVDQWHFAFGSESEIETFFKGLKTPFELGDDLSTPYVFIIDKERGLRGRNDDEDQGLKYGFDASSVSDLNNKMVDDVKIILAEYRLALKKNHGTASEP